MVSREIHALKLIDLMMHILSINRKRSLTLVINAMFPLDLVMESTKN